MLDPHAENAVIPDHPESPAKACRSSQSDFNQNPNTSSHLVIVDWQDWRDGLSLKDTWILHVQLLPWGGVWMLLMMISFFICEPFASARGWSPLAIAGLVVAPWIIGMAVFYKRLRPWKLSTCEKIVSGDRGSRVKLIASEAMLKQFGYPSLDPFEPKLFRVFGAVRGEKWLRRTIAVASFVMCIFALALLRGHGRLSASAFTGPMPISLDFQVGLLAAFMPSVVLWPTYFRVVPGRLDVLKYSMLGSGKPEVQKVDLRQGRLSVEAATGRLRIDLPSGERLYTQFHGSSSNKIEFAKAIAEAAISPHPTPPLPDDELVG